MLSSQSLKKKSSKMMRKRQRGEVLEALEIPLDLQIEILNRLPIKSLARFKCVSKLWSSLICSKGYIFPSPPRLFISFHDKPSKFVVLSLASTSSKSNTAFDLDMTKQGIRGRNMVVLRGLILYKTVCKQACICNPTTGQKITLPAVKFNMAKEICRNYFFGYDPVLDQYKVICSVTSVEPWRKIYTWYWAFVLEPGSFWKRIKFDQHHIPKIKKGSLCINGFIYYLAYHYWSGINVMSFDVRSEEFSMIQLPHEVSGGNALFVALIEYGGKPAIFDNRYEWDQSGLLNLWVLEDAGKWSKKSLALQSCHMHFFPNNIHFKVIGTTQNGEVILKPRPMYSPYYILYYNLHKNDVRRVDIRGISDEPSRLALMDTGESIMHLKI